MADNAPATVADGADGARERVFRDVAHCAAAKQPDVGPCSPGGSCFGFKMNPRARDGKTYAKTYWVCGAHREIGRQAVERLRAMADQDAGALKPESALDQGRLI